MRIKLVVRQAEGDGGTVSEHDFDGDLVTIGRSGSNDVVLKDPDRRVSGKHAKIERRGDVFYLSDEESTNGTFFRDQKLSPDVPVEIRSGDRFVVEVFELEFLVEESGLEATIARVDSARVASQLAEELRSLYAKHALDPPEERARVIREALRAGVAGADPEQARAIYSRVHSRFVAEFLSKDDSSAREALFRTTSALSHRFLDAAPFESADAAERFAKLIGRTLQQALYGLNAEVRAELAAAERRLKEE